MPSFKGRDVLIKIGNGGGPETFATIGAARAVSMVLDNQPVDATTMDGQGLQSLQSDAGVQSLQIRVDGLFKDAAAEETFRAQAFARSLKNYELIFPNDDKYAAAFAIENYTRGGAYDGIETFSATLRRSGDGVYTQAP
jgi:TP901-1 family phage major tail protein